ncbi:DUF3997 domain-containing protein [Parapedobacter koreensis]|uniref:DUF3997 domain-containing protein n=1 Tax=Parapedobacter koreensis TaxID=332977 RepID=A0A1H7UGI2_9SPHI|nr:DUF3997 domain-containing protein [Parapedobacter koreensis]SEL95854.1 Protein of unknown function [Parapedobacter koreensis]
MKAQSIIVAIWLLVGCSDATKELGSGYFLSIEGESANAIFNRGPDVDGIPPSVLRYGYNSKFIIAEQRPSRFNDVMYDAIDYSDGREAMYYWVILKESKTVFGPLNKDEFQQLREKYKVPTDLELKNVY